jgi:hypothetical protein
MDLPLKEDATRPTPLRLPLEAARTTAAASPSVAGVDRPRRIAGFFLRLP